MKKLKIEMIHDVVCSWCPIGYANLTQAIKDSVSDVEVDIRFLPFELNPTLPSAGQTIISLMKNRTNQSEDQISEYQAYVVAVGNEVNVKYDFTKRTHYYNTSNAHKLIHWAERYSKHKQLHEALIPEYFTNGKKISDLGVLSEVVESIGLNPAEAINSLSNVSIQQSFLKKKQKISTLQIQSIPSFLINDTELITGSKSSKYFTVVLDRSVGFSNSAENV